MITKQDLSMRNKIHMKALADDVNGFKCRYENLIKLGSTHPWDGNQDIWTKEQFKEKQMEKMNTYPKDDPLESVATREQVIERIGNQFHIWI